MDYLCICGRKSKICFKQFLNGQRCKKCGVEKSSEKLKHTLEFVKQYFKNNNCELLEIEYINNNTKMKYKCECGDVGKISFANFQKGKRCKKCGIKKMSGKNSPSYNPNLTDEDRADRRKIFGYNVWVRNTYKKNNYICQHCKEKKDNNNKYKKINAHHIEGYADNKRLRTKVSNGIVLCTDCHKKFHKIYGIKNNNRTQLDEFLKVGSLCLK